MRIMGLDFGSKTVGVAISDELLITAQGKEIIRRKEENKLRQTLARIEELIVEYDVQEIVLHFPNFVFFNGYFRSCIHFPCVRIVTVGTAHGTALHKNHIAYSRPVHRPEGLNRVNTPFYALPHVRRSCGRCG